MVGFDTNAPKTDKPVTEEVAISENGRDITIGFMGALREVQDTVLKRLGNNYKAYQELRRDDQVHACFQQRRLALTGRQLVIEPGGDDPQSIAAADFLRDNLAQIPFDRTCSMAMWGVLYGYSVVECMWEAKNGGWRLAKPKVRTAWRFRFSPQGELRLLTQRDMVRGEPMAAKKFWVTSWGADNDDDPYGLGLAHQLYWPVFFKKNGLGFWLRALEKHGAPSTVTKYPAGSDKSVRDQALQISRSLRVDGAAAIPDTMLVELLEAARGTVDQATFLRQMNAAISKIILGQTMTTDDGASLSQSQVHMGVREELTDADAELQCESFQSGPATWLTEWNFPGAKVPLISRPSPEDEKAEAELIETKAKAIEAAFAAGLEPESPEIITAFMPGWRLKPVVQVETLKPAPLALPAPKEPVAFAEAAAPDPVETYAADLDWEPLVDPIVKRMGDFILSKPDLQTAAAEFGALLNDPAGAAFVEGLASAMFEARLAGEAGLALVDAGGEDDQVAARS